MKQVCTLIVYLTIVLSISNCTKQKSFAHKNYVSPILATDTIAPLNILIDSLYINIKKEDTNRIKSFFDSTYNSADRFIDANTYNTKALTKYFAYLNSLMDTALTKQHNATLYLTKKGRALQYLMYINYTQGNAESIIQYYKELETPNVKIVVPKEKFIKRMHDVGAAYNIIGDITNAEKTYLETITLAKEINNDIDKSLAIINLSVVLDEKQLYDSIISLSSSVNSTKISNFAKGILKTNIADAYFQKNNFSFAEMYAKDAESIFINMDSLERPNDYYEIVGNLFFLKAQIFDKLGNYKNTDAYYAKALLYNLQTKTTKRYLAKLYIQIGNYKATNPSSSLPNTSLHYYNLALQALQPQLNITDSLVNVVEQNLTAENTYFEALDAKANWLLPAALQKKDTAILQRIMQYYTAAFLVEKKLLNNFVYDNAKINFLEASKFRTAKALEICNTMYSITKNSEWITQAFTLIETNKATVLLEKEKKNNILQKEIVNDSLVTRYSITKKNLVEATEKK